MIIVGLHFGHDASIAVLRDGQVVAFIEKERTSRIKHAIGLDLSDVVAALARCRLDIGDIDFVTVSAAQGLDYLFFDPAGLCFRLADSETVPSPFHRLLKADNAKPRPYPTLLFNRFKAGEFRVLQTGGQPPAKHDWAAANSRGYWGCDLDTLSCHPSIEAYVNPPPWRDGSCLTAHSLDLETLAGDQLAMGFHLPIVATVGGRRIPGAMVSHHYAHSAYAYYSGPVDSALVVSLDGGVPDDIPYAAGMLFLGHQGRLIPLYPPWLNVGFLYARIGQALGFDGLSAPGKLMGLSSYGAPLFSADRFADTFVGQRQRIGVSSSRQTVAEFKKWVQAAAAAQTIDLSGLGDQQRVLEPGPAAVAASIQRIFETAIRRAIGGAMETLANSGIFPGHLVMTGGCALNCPTNSTVSREFGFKSVFVPPGAGDSGLSIGSAQALYHGVFRQPRREHVYSDGPAYLGNQFTRRDIDAAVAKVADRIIVAEHGEAVPRLVAEALSSGNLVGWFEGASEIGPRALGHRSILADPRVAANWRRVNQVKGREEWRPLAPMVLADQAERWFFGAPAASPFMLFTHFVASGDLPAVTHVDHTARIQTVDSSCGAVYRTLREFHAMTGIPVLMNTSFNGPAEPIVESPDDAIGCFLERGLDLLAIGDYLVRRRETA
jgi:carbamoyltransferase